MSALGLLLLLGQGAVAPSVKLEDQSGNVRTVPSAKPTLVIHEDQDGGKQNTRAKELLGKLNARVENQARVDVLAVADLEKWDWWPAKKYALADIQKIARDKKTTIYVDWKGAVRKAWGLARKTNSLVLIGADGKVLFSSEGDCSEAQLEQLLSLLVQLGWQR